MKTTKLMFWTLLVVFLCSITTAEAWTTFPNVKGRRGSWGFTYNGQHYSNGSFTVVIPANASKLIIRTGQDGRGGSGSLDLYVRYGRYPTSTKYLKRKIGPGYKKTITIKNPPAGRYIVRIRGRTNYRASFQNIALL